MKPSKKILFRFQFEIDTDFNVRMSRPPENPEAVADMVGRITAFCSRWYLGQMARGNMVEVMDGDQHTGMYVYQPVDTEAAARLITPARVPLVGPDGRRLQ